MGPESLVLVVERKGKEKNILAFLIVIAFLFDRGDVKKEKIEPYIKPLGFFSGGPWVPWFLLFFRKNGKNNIN